MKLNTKPSNKLYAIHYKGILLSTIDWGNNSTGISSTLQGWRPAKKVYFTLGTAKSGITHLPEIIRKDCSIVEYTPNTKNSTLKFDETAYQIRKVKVKIKELEKGLSYYIQRDGFPDLVIKYKTEIKKFQESLVSLEKEKENNNKVDE